MEARVCNTPSASVCARTIGSARMWLTTTSTGKRATTARAAAARTLAHGLHANRFGASLVMTSLGLVSTCDVPRAHLHEHPQPSVPAIGNAAESRGAGTGPRQREPLAQQIALVDERFAKLEIRRYLARCSDERRYRADSKTPATLGLLIPTPGLSDSQRHVSCETFIIVPGPATLISRPIEVIDASR